jgi:hypothetical protein
MYSLYETDFYAWTHQQSELLRSHQWSKLDLPNLIEEIESLGRQQRQEIRNRLTILLGHLLKWQYQPEQRSRSWLSTIRVQQLDLADLLEDNPSLPPDLEAAVEKAYRKAVVLAVGETNLPDKTFPSECPYPLASILSDRFYPGEPSDAEIEESC